MKRKRQKIVIVADIIGEGIHTMLRKVGQSVSAQTAWHMINDMPDGEWESICLIVAQKVISVLDDEEENENSHL